MKKNSFVNSNDAQKMFIQEFLTFFAGFEIWLAWKMCLMCSFMDEKVVSLCKNDQKIVPQKIVKKHVWSPNKNLKRKKILGM